MFLFASLPPSLLCGQKHSSFVSKELTRYILEITLSSNSRNTSTSKYKQFLTLKCAFLLFEKQQYFRVQFNARQSSILKLQFLSVTFINGYNKSIVELLPDLCWSSQLHFRPVQDALLSWHGKIPGNFDRNNQLIMEIKSQRNNGYTVGIQITDILLTKPFKQRTPHVHSSDHPIVSTIQMPFD